MPSIPRPIVTVHGEDVNVEVPGILTLRASFLSEGLFDEAAQGDPSEEDLYEIEVTDEGEDVPMPLTFSRLMPAAPQSWLDDADESPARLPMEEFLLVLAWRLAHTDPADWYSECDAARRWDSWTVEDLALRLPPEWTPAVLPPTDD